jgi:hypothetical protein
MKLKDYTRIRRALLRAGTPFVTQTGLEQLRRARKGEALSTGDDGRYYLQGARRGLTYSSDPLRMHIRQRVFNIPSSLVVAESLRQLVQDIADAGNRPAKIMILAMDSGLYHGALVGNHYAYREKEGMVSYCPAGRTQAIGENGKWERAGRQETTPARWVRSVLKEARIRTFRDSELAEFAEKFKAAELKSKVALEESLDFAEAYKPSNYTTTEGGNYSCMWDEPVQEFYQGAPCCVLVARRGDGKMMGRALIWHDVQGTGGARFMDRVYSALPEIREMYVSYAQEKGIWKKEKESAQCRSWLLPDGSRSFNALTVEHSGLDGLNFYPYMDTFLHSADNTLTSAGDDGQEFAHHRTDGTREELDTHAGQVQLENGDWIDQDDACDVNGSLYHMDECVTCERSGDWILITDAYRVEIGRNNTVYIHEDYVERA